MYCPNCGSENSVSANFCQKCASLLNNVASNSPQLLAQKDNSQSLYLVVIAFLAVIVVGGVGLFFYNQNQQSSYQYQPQSQTQSSQETSSRTSTTSDKEEREREKKEKELQESHKIASENLNQEMLRIAETEARSRHKASNLEQCSSLASDVETISNTSERTELERLFNCSMKGAIIGVSKFDVGVKVRGEIVKQGNVFKGKIISSYVSYDRGG